ncbi:MAG: hypothetical protein ACK4RV_00705 [Caulobacter sp.]|jgi:hypothetical protein
MKKLFAALGSAALIAASVGVMPTQAASIKPTATATDAGRCLANAVFFSAMIETINDPEMNKSKPQIDAMGESWMTYIKGKGGSFSDAAMAEMDATANRYGEQLKASDNMEGLVNTVITDLSNCMNFIQA